MLAPLARGAVRPYRSGKPAVKPSPTEFAAMLANP